MMPVSGVKPFIFYCLMFQCSSNIDHSLL